MLEYITILIDEIGRKWRNDSHVGHGPEYNQAIICGVPSPLTFPNLQARLSSIDYLKVVLVAPICISGCDIIKTNDYYPDIQLTALAAAVVTADHRDLERHDRRAITPYM